MNNKLSKIYNFLFIILVATTIILPTGSIYGIPYKNILTLILVGIYGYFYFTKQYKPDRFFLILLFSFLAVLGSSAIIGFLKGNELQLILSEGFSFTKPLALLVLVGPFKDRKKLGKVLIDSALAYSIFKLIMIFVVMFRMVTVVQLDKWYQKAFSAFFVTMDILPELPLIRMYLVNDLIYVAVLPLLWLLYKDKKFQFILYYFIYSVGVYLSYSRFLWAIYLAAAVMVALYEFFKDRFNWKVVLFNFIMSNIITYTIYKILFTWGAPFFIKIFGSNFSDIDKNGSHLIVNSRFSADELAKSQNSASDSVRTEQFQAIFNLFKENLFLGAGLGAYSKDILRNNVKTVYELQIPALVMKLGIPLTILFSVIVLTYLFKVLNNNIYYIAVAGVVFSSGLFNPYLLTSVFGACILAIIVCSDIEKSLKTKMNFQRRE
ncbi:hypothetical protein CKN63_00745 [Carnobacterium divergens]|uniref:O-antigen ligase family protein n=1 Tax=Carnobacterium divergens TaxID=2748 RepID=UPI000E75D208|nr:O-antigen ligase family protein [Carnobacterium divergens]ANZ99233.1 hypothetical protein BFC22_03545 [Carnobacterium divergens]TFI68990.1 hypothetical protein CKN59_00745 [Carnobacterium divergens]TFI69115.1 hypothetical protein CKN76_00745 [Carnobacterium divergens]TFI83951.1 hypothetical protein CKN74_00745 [Carnobacterium divergens]TFJ10195.1 hypothetical protein CKN75_00745 [Carnobacterium divergens]